MELEIIPYEVRAHLHPTRDRVSERASSGGKGCTLCNPAYQLYMKG